MKKRMLMLMSVVLVFVLVFVAGCGSASTTAPTSNEKKPFVIGAVFDITGPASSLGIPEKNSAQMLVDQINKAGGINGHKVDLKILDDKSTPAEAALDIKQLIEQDHVLAVIGASTSGASMSMVPIAMDKQIPMVSAAASAAIVRPASDHKWIFKTAQPDDLVAKVVVTYLKAHNITSVAFMPVNNDFGNSGLKEFQAQAGAAGINIVTVQKFEASDTDMTAQLTKVKDAKPQAVIVWSTPPSAAYVAKSYKQLGLTMPQIQSHGIGNKSFIDVAGDAANGVIFPAGKLLAVDTLSASDPQKSVLSKYASDYQAAFPGQALSTFGGHAYDATNMVLDALKASGDNPTASSIRDQLEKISNYPGITGVFNMSPSEHNGLDTSSMVWIKIANGKWTLDQN